ncbi:MAG: flavin reductase [Lachnospiraceae bacterium]|nr:flavin reductase [Lachnospiraceae bacterium]MDD3795602.1 flavin reductase [Lachnospiraceae bacterium]
MFKEITAKELQENPFKMIGEDWLLVTAQKDGKVNTMTASWGGVGVMWGKDVAYIVIRPQRYTKEFIDGSDTLSLSILPEGHKDIYGYLGKVSGREEDKIAKSRLTVAHADGTPYFEEAKTVLICKKMFAQPLAPESFLDPSLIERWYPDGDFHAMYICEIQKVLIAQPL